MNFKFSTALIAALVLPLSVMAQNVTTVNGKPVPMAANGFTPETSKMAATAAPSVIDPSAVMSGNSKMRKLM